MFIDAGMIMMMMLTISVSMLVIMMVVMMILFFWSLGMLVYQALIDSFNHNVLDVLFELSTHSKAVDVLIFTVFVGELKSRF